MEREERRGAVREMGDGQTCRDASVLVHDKQIGDARGQARARQLRQHSVSPVEPDRQREQQSQFLGELHQSRRRRPRRRDQRLGINQPRHAGVFVVDGRGRGRGIACCAGFVEFEVLAQLPVVGNVLGEGLAAREGLSQFGPPFGDGGFFEAEGFAEDEVAPFAVGSAELH